MMKKYLLKICTLILSGFLAFENQAIAQCSGGIFDANIVPTGVTQTVPVANAGLYYTFSAIAGGVYQFSFCAADGGAASYDTQITIIDDATSVYAGGYNDDWCGLQSYLQWTCTTSGIYRALVSQYYCNAVGGSPATLAYKLLPPSNDQCSGAISIGTTSTITGSTQFATSDSQIPCVTTDGTGGGVWYAVNGNGNQLHASLCGSTFDTRIRVFTGSCGVFTCVTGNDDGTCAPQSTVDFCSVTGTTYYILVHGTGADAGAFTLNMSETAVPPISITQFGYSYCGSGSVTFVASGYPTYNWSPPAGLNTTTGSTVIASPSVTTTYTVVATDAATGCPAYNNATVTVYPIPVVTAVAGSPTICSVGSSTLTASGASTYSWMPGSLSGSTVTVSPASTTTYTVTGTSVDACTNTNTVTVTVYALPNVVASSASTAVCIGSFATLNGSGAITYSWMPGNLSGSTVNVTPSSTTTYTVTGTDANGCVNTNTLSMPVNPLPIISATASPDTVCTGNVDTLTASGAVSYVWSNGPTTNPEIVSPSTLTTYTVTGTDANGCVNTGTVTVYALLSGPVSTSSAYPSICIGSSDILNAIGASFYNWMPGNLSGSQITVSPAATTTYTVTGSSTNGCIKTDSITVFVNSLPIVSASASVSSFCSGASTTLTANGATSYSWSPGNSNGNPITVSPTTSTTYTATGTDANGCQNTATVALTIFATPTVTATSSPAVVCLGNQTNITASGAQTYIWMPGSLTGTTISVSPVTSTTYTVTGISSNGCTDSYPINIAVVSPANLIVYSSETTVCANDAVVYLYGIPAGGIWSGLGVSGTTFTPSVAGAGSHVCTYTFIDQYGCTATATTSIFVNACVGISEQSGLNGISFYPNPNDGLFTVNVASSTISEMKIDIFDLQGRIIYSEMMNGIISGFSKEINLNGIANGAYYIRFSSKNSTATEKLIIHK